MECVSEKNSTLIRSDISQGLRNLYDAVRDDALKSKALALIETETDAKYRKKYRESGRSNESHHNFEDIVMCRNIKTLYNFEPPVSDDEIHAAALQFVRKISGFSKPSQANQAAFLAAVEEIAAAASKLLNTLETNAPPKNRDDEAAKAHQRSAQRFTR